MQVQCDHSRILLSFLHYPILFGLGFTVFASCNAQSGACGCGEHGETSLLCGRREGEGFERLQTT